MGKGNETSLFPGWINAPNGNATDNATKSDYSKCDYYGKTIDNVRFYRVVLIPAFLCILLLAFHKKRKRLCPQLFHGRPGLIYPVNLLQGEDHRVPLIACFVFLGWVMIQFVTNQPCGSTFYTSEGLPDIGPFYGVASYVIFAFIFYPIFASLSCHSIFGYAVGTVYIWVLAPVLAIDGVQRVTANTNKLDLYIVQGAALLPPTICLVYLVVIFPMRLVAKVQSRKLHKAKQSIGDARFTYSPQIEYINHLLKRKKDEKSLVKRILCWPYTNVPGFKYSTSILAAVSMGICFMYMFAVGTLRKFYIYFETYKEMLANPNALEETSKRLYVQLLATFYKMPLQEFSKKWLTEEKFWIFIVGGVIYASIVIALGAIVCGLISTLLNYRKHTLQLYKGSHKEIPKYKRGEAQSLLIEGVKFVGYQIAYVTVGYIILVFFFGIILLGIVGLVAYVIRYEAVWILDLIFRKLWAIIVATVILKLTQYLMARYCFLLKDAHNEKVLALDNRRLFFNFHYFSIFANIALGVVSSIERILKGIVFGLLYFPRIDSSILCRRFEHFDPGFHTYVGMLHLEHIHRNPIMLSFVGILTQNVEFKKLLERNIRGEIISAKILDVPGIVLKNGVQTVSAEESISTNLSTSKKSRARIRWLLMISLINNPTLKQWRKHNLNHAELKTKRARKRDRLKEKFEHTFINFRHRITVNEA